MHALRNIHAALVPNGLLVDTQPISPHPPVSANGVLLGAIDMREWSETIRAVDARVDQALAAGLYELTDERGIVVTSIFDDGHDCLAITGTWRGTRVPQLLQERLDDLRNEVVVEQQVRLRVLRRGQASA